MNAYEDFAEIDASQKIVRMTADPAYFKFVLEVLIKIDSNPEFNGIGILPSKNDQGSSLLARSVRAGFNSSDRAENIMNYLLQQASSNEPSISGMFDLPKNECFYIGLMPWFSK